MQPVPEERAQAPGGKRCSAGTAGEARSKAQGLGRGRLAQINGSANSGTSWALSPFISVSTTVNRESTDFPCAVSILPQAQAQARLSAPRSSPTHTNAARKYQEVHSLGGNLS